MPSSSKQRLFDYARLSNSSAVRRLRFLIFLLAWATYPWPSSRAQLAPDAEASRTGGRPHTITVKGCLNDAGSEGFSLTSDADVISLLEYRVIGPASVLKRYTYANEWDTVQIVGVVDGSGDSDIIRMRSIKVTHRQIRRSPEVGSLSSWLIDRDADYGISVKHPASFQPLAGRPDQQQHSNFVRPGSAKTLLALDIPREIYPNTAFAGGSVSVSVSDDIPNAATCRVFREAWQGTPAPRSVRGVSYSEAIITGVAGGTSYPGYFFHTFQNGRCYEVNIELAIGNVGSYAMGCDLDLIDEEALLNPILSGISFSKPSVAADLRHPNVDLPTILSFEATSVPSGRVIPDTTISWSVSGADYVRIAFKCDPNITTAEREVECEAVPYASYAYGDQGSIRAGFQNRNEGPAPVLVTLQPFLNGVGNPNWSKTISVPIPPIK